MTEIEINHLFAFFSYLISIAFYGYLVVAIVFLILDNRQNSSTFAWIFIFILLPVVGLVLYLFFGKNHRIIGRHRKKIHQMIGSCFPENTKRFFKNHKKMLGDLTKEEPHSLEKKLMILLEKNSYSLLTDNNQVEILQNGKEKFPALIKDIQNAKKTIHLTYFIWKNDPFTKQMQEILIKKAKEGVEVRILIDAWGSILLPQRYRIKMRKAGVKIFRYFDFRFPLTIHTINYRNHRKIAVIDGKIGYTGGINMGKEYLSGGKQFDFWRDTHFRVKGEAAVILQSIFALEWENTTKEKLNSKKYFPEIKELKNPGLKTEMQITTSGPDSNWESIRQMFFLMINGAKKKIEIQSPYFVPGESLITALKTAALSGVEIKIMIAGMPDKKLPYWAAFTYFEELLRAGVKIYHYEKGFLHSKTISVDSKICSIGTANFDLRSFLINYELMAIFYDKKVTRNLESDFENDLKECTQMTKDHYQEINPLAKFRNSVARLFSSIL